MLLIIFSWIYIFLITSVIGVGVASWFKLNFRDSIVTLFFGMFSISVFAGLFSIFMRVNWEFQALLLAICLLIFFKEKIKLKDYFSKLFLELKSLSLFLKVSLWIIFLLILAKCASNPYILDNESYYIQTIKWLNEYGLVKGLVNLHIFLGQLSGWHILQSVFNFSFLYDNFNDLSGFCLLLGNIFAIFKLNEYLISGYKNSMDLIIGLFPLGNIFFFQFIGAPSPDIGVYVISFIMFSIFSDSYKEESSQHFISLCFLTFFVVFIKITAIFLCIIPLIVLLKKYSYYAQKLKLVVILGLVTSLVFFTKNYIINGNILSPLTGIVEIYASWSLPIEIQEYYTILVRSHAYNLSVEAYQNADLWFLTKSWFMTYGLKGLFNKVMIFLLLIFPLFFRNKRIPKVMIALYLIAFLNMLFLFYYSPQFRFFFHFIFILGLTILCQMIRKRNQILIVFSLAILLPLSTLILDLKLNKFTNNRFHLASSKFSVQNFIHPHVNSRYGSDFKVYAEGNLKINHPLNIEYFWGTGDIEIPSLNKEQFEYFKTNFGVVPQLRTGELNDGFNSQKVAELK